MKRKNLLTNIAGLILQLAMLIWFFVIYDDSDFTLLNFFIGFNSGIVILAILVVAYIAIASMILVVGIKNRNSSIARMILYIVSFVFYILQLLFIYLEYIRYEDIYFILLMISHFILYGLLLALFILNKKSPKSEKKVKYDFIIFGSLMGLLLFAFILQPIYVNLVKYKFKKAGTDREQLENKAYIEAYKDAGRYDFLNAQGQVEFSIAADKIVSLSTIGTEKGKALQLLITQEGKKIKCYDIKDVQNIKELAEFSISEEFYPNGLLNVIKYEDDDYKMYYVDSYIDEENYLKKIESNDMAEYETEQNSDYTYYSNSQILLQEVKNVGKINLEQLEENDITSAKNAQYYLIKKDEGRKIKLECKNLLYNYNSSLGDKQIQLYSKKYIPFVDEKTNGYFDENGNKFELNNNFVFLDVGDNISIVQKVNENDKSIETNENEDFDYDNYESQIVVVDKNLDVISETYNYASFVNGLYILTKEEEYGDSIHSIWSKKTGKKLGENNYLVNNINGENLLAKNKDGTFCIYNEDGIIEDKQYKEKELHYLLSNSKNINNKNIEENNLINIYYQILEQMK